MPAGTSSWPRRVDSVLPAGQSVLRGVSDSFSLRLTSRNIYFSIVLLTGLGFVLFASLVVGEYRVTVPEVLVTLRGEAPSDRINFFITERRLPRALVAMAVGAALATAGSVFQSVTRNPLASPDIIGVSAGASAGAAFVILMVDGSPVQAALGAFVGAVLTAGLIAVLAGRNGLSGLRVVLVGVALGALASAAVSYMLTQVFVASAVTAQLWLIGSLQGRGWDELWFIVPALLLALPVLARFSGRLRILAMGEELATALGVRVEPTRRVLLLFATLLVAVAVATAGPISFIALAAPHISRRITRTTALFPAIMIGSLLLALSDLIAQNLFTHPIPVGVVTITIGGVFFLWLLVHEGSGRDR